VKQLHALPGVRVEGVEPGEGLHLSRLRIVQRLDAPSQCEVSWSASNSRLPVLQQQAVEPGAALSVHIDGQPSVAFSGEVTGIEHLHEPSGAFTLRVRAYDALGRLQRRQTVRTHVEITTAELARTLADGAGLDTQASVDGPVWPRIVPRFVHDLALLREYAARSGLHFFVHDGVLRLFSPHAPEGDILELALGKDLFEARLERNAVRPVDTMRLLGWDPHTGEPRRAQSSGVRAGAAGGRFSGERVLLGATAESDSEAESLLAAELERSQAAGAVLWGVAEGDVALKPGRRIRVEGVAAGMEGPYLLRTVEHILDADSGYVCELDTRPEKSDRPPAMPALISAEVCDVDDPEDRGRVQVSLDSFGDAQSTWMMVLQLGAGNDKGVVVLPEVGDRVLVALPDGDPSRGVVLGGLFHHDGPPPDPDAAHGTGEHRPFTLVTRGGQRIRLNDADGSIRLENAEGSFLSLTPDGLLLHAEGELVIEAPGRRLVLGADRIDMQRRT
jgi:uncharacterized protein involved in type VI secretion and phage assembly